jgi:DNA-binding CsgD family transcriptional regulator
VADLTPRQLEVLRGLADGKRLQEMATELWLSPGTIRTHRTALFKALAARTAAHAVAIGYQRGILRVPHA